MLKKVWNITDHPMNDIQPTSIMIFRRMVVPGSYVWVPEESLKSSKKLMEDAQKGLVFIGNDLPAHYLNAKHPPRAKYPTHFTRAHGPTVAAIKEEAVKAVEEKLVPKKEAKKEDEKVTPKEEKPYDYRSKKSKKDDPVEE